ncbi:hypothetical protein V5F59_10875 [Xanthobacter autotrophicus DSM 431]|uniref:hypothetical protein n=1 Tax=Xanthobacter nonsaccharivorans TaxID=3119912 RepID=UPI0037282FCF
MEAGARYPAGGGVPQGEGPSFDRPAAAGDRNPWIGEAARLELVSRPGYAQALASYASGFLAIHTGNRLLNAVLGDRGRTVFWLFIFYLEALPRDEGGGLAAGRLIQLCTTVGLCSPGRTRALLALMQWAGYLAPASESGGDRRVKPLEIQEKMYQLQRQRWHILFASLALVAPEVAVYQEKLADLAFTRSMARLIGDRYLKGERIVAAAPALKGLLDHDCAVLLLLALYGVDHAGLPPPTIADLSRRFHVSRTHVLKVLRTAQASGLVEPPPERGVGRLSAAGRGAVAHFFAAGFCLIASCAWEAGRND